MSLRRMVMVLLAGLRPLAELARALRFDAARRYRLRHKPLAGPREGAQLPG